MTRSSRWSARLGRFRKPWEPDVTAAINRAEPRPSEDAQLTYRIGNTTIRWRRKQFLAIGPWVIGLAFLWLGPIVGLQLGLSGPLSASLVVVAFVTFLGVRAFLSWSELRRLRSKAMDLQKQGHALDQEDVRLRAAEARASGAFDRWETDNDRI